MRFYIYTNTDGSLYICYQDSSCGNSTDRPVFTLADSFTECCGLPDVMSVYDSSANNCENCGEYIIWAKPFYN